MGAAGLEVDAAHQPLGLQALVDVGVIVGAVTGVDLGRQIQVAVLLAQGGESLVVGAVAEGGVDGGDDARLGVDAGVGLVADVAHLLVFGLPLGGDHAAAALLHQAGIGVAGRVALLLALALLSGIHIGTGVHAVEHLDAAHLQPLGAGLLDQVGEDGLQSGPPLSLLQAAFEDRQGGVVGGLLVDGQAQEPLEEQVEVRHLDDGALGGVVEVGEEQDLEQHHGVIGGRATLAPALVEGQQLL